MGSLFTTVSGQTLPGFGNLEKPVPFYLQFVPGNTVAVVHSQNDMFYEDESSINSIIALPHISNDVVNTLNNINPDKHRYYPLLRGISDIPTKGDPVMLFTIGNIQYYLGPLNQLSNNPTWNADILMKKTDSINRNINLQRKKSFDPDSPPSILNTDNLYSRLQKPKNNDLDTEVTNPAHETTGDTIIEGRHGNSIRIGSRDKNPYIYISNGRGNSNTVETLNDQNLISITSFGTLDQHFPGSVIPAETDSINKVTLNDIATGFSFASDVITSVDNPQKRFMSDLILSVNDDTDIKSIIHNYSGHQMLFSSGRIIFNSKNEDISLSSNKDIHIGTKRHLTISTNENLIIESEKTYLGNPNVEDRQMEQMVLGNKLLELFKETLSAIKAAQGTCMGAPIPLGDETGAPGSLKMKITEIEGKVDEIVSSKHFIEPNE